LELDAIRQTIIESKPDDWHVVVCWGASAGPSFLDQFTVWKSGAGDGWSLDVNSHAIRGVYRPDAALGIAYGLDYSRDPDGRAEKLSFDWAERFPNKTVTASWADVFWNGSLVDRQIVFNADGGNVTLPAPYSMYHTEPIAEPPEVIGEYVTQWEYHIARVVAGLEHQPERFAADVELAGFTVLDR
jgi:hypothetical protein